MWGLLALHTISPLVVSYDMYGKQQWLYSLLPRLTSWPCSHTFALKRVLIVACRHYKSCHLTILTSARPFLGGWIHHPIVISIQSTRLMSVSWGRTVSWQRFTNPFASTQQKSLCVTNCYLIHSVSPLPHRSKWKSASIWENRGAVIKPAKQR